MKTTILLTLLTTLSVTLAAPPTEDVNLSKRDSSKEWEISLYALLNCKGYGINTGTQRGSTPFCRRDATDLPANHPARGPYARSYSFKGPPGKKCTGYFYYDDVCSDPAEVQFSDENLACMNAPGAKASSWKVICKD